MPSSHIKDPDATLDYTFDFGTWLGNGQTIVDYTVTVADGLTLDSDSNTDTEVVVWLSGGTVGETYTVAARITTSSDPARIDERTQTIHVRER